MGSQSSRWFWTDFTIRGAVVVNSPWQLPLQEDRLSQGPVSPLLTFSGFDSMAITCNVLQG